MPGFERVEITFNDKEVLLALEHQAYKALMECGLVAAGYAKDALTPLGAVDTGLLRNSVTFAIAGD